MIYQLSAAGQTIFVSTHYMDEAEYCHRLALMYRGKVIALGTPAELKHSLSHAINLLHLEVSDLSRQHERAARRSRGSRKSPCSAAACTSRLADATRADSAKSDPALEQAGISVPVLEPIQPSMEDVFVAMIEEEERKTA